MKYFSMFTGIGGFELGIQQAYESISKKTNNQLTFTNGNMQNTINENEGRQPPTCVGYSEIDKYCNQLLSVKFPTVKNYGDATKIDEQQLPDFDLLVGGFPCQSFSIAGKRKGFDDTRGTLFFDIARILAHKKPRNVLLENVKGLLSHDGGRTFQTIIGVLTDLGYFVEWQVLNSKNFGVPQNRERVFIIGHLGGEPKRKVFPVGEGGTANDDKRILAHTINSSDWRGANRNQQQTTIQQLNNPTHSNDRVYGEEGISPTLNTMQGGRRQPKITHRDLRYVEDGLSPTIRSGGSGGVPSQRIIKNMKIRRLTPLECERLQGFPDNFTSDFSDTQRYKMMGNAVTVNVVQYVIEKMFQTYTPHSL